MPAPPRFSELPLSAQTAYGELFEQTREFELRNALAGLVGSFHKVTRKGRKYWYFSYRDLDQKVRMAYIGPDDDRSKALVSRFEAIRIKKPLSPVARSAIALGCTPAAPKHFRMIKRLSEYGFFRAGGILIGTHAFLALGNLLGVRWRHRAATLDVDLAHAGRNISLALPADLKIDVPGALESLEMGLLPLRQFDGTGGAQYRNPSDPELRLDFVTSMTRNGKPVQLPELNLALEPLKFLDLLLDGPTQASVIGNQGACIVNVPVPERFAVHKLIVHGERPVAERAKATKDLLQTASLASYFEKAGQARVFNRAWNEALDNGKHWRDRLLRGKRALLQMAPDLSSPALWRE